MKYLVENGADINAKKIWDDTALTIAKNYADHTVYREDDYRDVIKYLIHAEAE